MKLNDIRQFTLSAKHLYFLVCCLRRSHHGHKKSYLLHSLINSYRRTKRQAKPKRARFSLLGQPSSGGLAFWVLCSPRKHLFHLCTWKIKHLLLTVPDPVSGHILQAAFICQAYHSSHLLSAQQGAMLRTGLFAMQLSLSIKNPP